MSDCYLCNKPVKFYQRRSTINDICKGGFIPPSGMMEGDVLCQECYDYIKNTLIPNMDSEKEEKLRSDLEFMMIHRVFDEITIDKKIPDDEYDAAIQEVTKKVSPVFKKLNYEQFFDYWKLNLIPFQTTFTAIRNYLDGKITVDEFKIITYESWSSLTEEYVQTPIWGDYRQYDVFVVGYFVALLDKIFYNRAESEVEQFMTEIKENLLSTIKDNLEAQKLWRSLVDNVVKKTILATNKYFQ